MNNNLERRVRGNRWRIARNIVLATAIGYTSFKSGQYNEANNNHIKDKRIIEQVTDAVVNEGYAWKHGSDHLFFKYEPALIKDQKNGEMWGEFVKDSVYTGRVRKDGKIGNTFDEQVEEYSNKTWESIKQGSKNAWEKTRDWAREKIDYFRSDKNATEQ